MLQKDAHRTRRLEMAFFPVYNKRDRDGKRNAALIATTAGYNGGGSHRSRIVTDNNKNSGKNYAEELSGSE